MARLEGWSNSGGNHEYDPWDEDDESCYHCGAPGEYHTEIKSHLNDQQFPYRKGQRTHGMQPHEMN